MRAREILIGPDFLGLLRIRSSAGILWLRSWRGRTGIGRLRGSRKGCEDNRNERSIDFWIDKHQRFAARLAAEEVLRERGALVWSFRPRLFGNPDERVVWLKNRWYHLPLYVRPFLYFFYRYFLRLGVLDGPTGFVYHFLHAFWFRMIVDIKIAELRQELSAG